MKPFYTFLNFFYLKKSVGGGLYYSLHIFSFGLFLYVFVKEKKASSYKLVYVFVKAIKELKGKENYKYLRRNLMNNIKRPLDGVKNVFIHIILESIMKNVNCLLFYNLVLFY